MPAPIPGGKVARHALKHLRANDERDVTDAIDIARLIALGHDDEAIERLAALARRNQSDSAIGLYLEVNEISEADDVIMAVTAAERRKGA